MPVGTAMRAGEVPGAEGPFGSGSGRHVRQGGLLSGGLLAFAWQPPVASTTCGVG